MKRLNYIVFQHGNILIGLLIVMFFVGVLYGVGQTNHTRELQMQTKKRTWKTLSLAKKALLSYTSFESVLGKLPCLEDLTLIGYATEGNAKTSCTNNVMWIGRFPWRTFDVGNIVDGNGDTLLYAISPGFQTSPINSSKSGQLSIDGVSDVVAIIFSPGTPNQKRSTLTKTSTLNISEYLEGSNQDGDMAFVTQDLTTTNFNDQLIAITRTELFKAVHKRILSTIIGYDTASAALLKTDSYVAGLQHFICHSGNLNKVYPYADTNADGKPDGAFIGTPPYSGEDVTDGILDTKKSGINFADSTFKTNLVKHKWFPLITYDLAADRKSVKLSIGSGDAFYSQTITRSC